MAKTSELRISIMITDDEGGAVKEKILLSAFCPNDSIVVTGALRAGAAYLDGVARYESICKEGLSG